MTFPTNRLHDIQQNPANFKLLELMPAINWQLPITLNKPTGDTFRFAIVDEETTGLEPKECEIIEFGFVVATVDKETGIICTVERAGSYFNKPTKPIEQEITDITGITNDDVKNHHLNMNKIMDAFSGVDLCIAHNAKFDRAFLDMHVQKMGYPALQIPWACSIKDADWRTLRYESNALGYLLFKNGLFFHGHRAQDDCLATLYALHLEPVAMQRIITAFTTPTFDLRVNSRFEAKDALNEMGCQWDGAARQWHKLFIGTEKDTAAEIDRLKTADINGLVTVELCPVSPTMRYASL